MNTLPRDIKLEILIHLNYSELNIIRLINKEWNALYKDEKIWQTLLIKQYGKNIIKIDNTWFKSYYKYYIFDYIILKFFNNSIENFMNFMIKSLLSNMKINIDNLLKCPDELYYLNIEDPKIVNDIKKEYEYKITEYYEPIDNNIYKYIKKETQDIMDMISSFAKILEKSNMINILLNTPILILSNLNIHNISGLNNYNSSYRAGINIHDTKENFQYRIPKQNISMMDLLKGIMSVKSSKVDFWYELYTNIKLDLNKNILEVEFDHGC